MAATPDLGRVLVVATHPDDDVIGAGGLLQRVLATGGKFRVLFVTGGEQNDWPQRAMLRKWRITAADRAEWAQLRRGEAECALLRIGGRAESAIFLGYPDQKISDLARAGDHRLRDEIARTSAEFRPTLVIAPSHFDIHRDHRATAYFVHRAIDQSVPIATYVVHGSLPPAKRAMFTIQLTPEEQKHKLHAIGCHHTQLLLSRKRFLDYAAATETFYRAEYDVVRIDSRLRERVIAFRHALRAVAGALRR